MSNESGTFTSGFFETLFKEHSFEEIESVRDNLATEIDKRTELLKSIVKEKYHDVVETSDAIHSMKLNLNKVEQSIHALDKNISSFYARIREPTVQKNQFQHVQSGTSTDPNINRNIKTSQEPECPSDIIDKLVQSNSDMWDHFDAGNLKMSVKAHKRSLKFLEDARNDTSLTDKASVLDSIETNLNRAREMMKNYLWYRIKSAEPNQIGVIAGGDESDLFRLGLCSSVDFLVEKFLKDITDMSYQAQIRRYQPSSYFNTQTSQIDPEVNDLKPPSTGYVQIPKSVSTELSTFLYEVCRVINTIAGFSLNRYSITESLRITIEQIMKVYSDLAGLVDELKSETKRRRALQLYFDMTYIRVLLNTSKHMQLVEDLDPKISTLTNKFEFMLDPIELYMISEALHNNVLNLSQSTMRLYGLLIPYLQ